MSAYKRIPSKRCSFCGNARERVRHLLQGPDGVRICDGCVTDCLRLIAEAERLRNEAPIDIPIERRAASSQGRDT